MSLDNLTLNTVLIYNFALIIINLLLKTQLY